MKRFTKIDANGQPLPDDATEWVAVLDQKAGLIWSAQNAVDGPRNHADAEAACKDLRLCGNDDWRLPTVEELFALADRTRYEPAIDTDFFPTTESDWYWTSTSWASSPGYAWIVAFDYGYSAAYRRSDNAFVRAVRAVPGQ